MELFSSTGDIDHLKSALTNFYKNYYTGTLTLLSLYLMFLLPFNFLEANDAMVKYKCFTKAQVFNKIELYAGLILSCYFSKPVLHHVCNYLLVSSPPRISLFLQDPHQRIMCYFKRPI